MRFSFVPLLLIGIHAAAAPVVYVDPKGADSRSGGEGAPRATVDAALARLRELRSGAGGGEIRLAPGTYIVESPIRLSGEDGGTEEEPVQVRAVERGTVRLVGGRILPASSFNPVVDPTIRARLEERAVDSVLTADLAALGVEDLGEFPNQFSQAVALPELFFNGERMTLARWPNEGWAEIAEVLESGPAPWRNHNSDQRAVFRYEGDRPARWLSAPAVWLHGYWCFDWAAETIRVGGIDPATRTLTLAHDHVYGLGSGNPARRRYCAVNLLEELDSPGEYFIDRETRSLYFHPPAPLSGSEIILADLAEPLLHLSGTSHLRIEGLTFDMTAGDAIRVEGGESVWIAGCTVRNPGLAGILIEGGTSHRVLSCDIHHTGTSGVRISGGDRKTLSPSGHGVSNNHVHHISRRQRTAAYHIELRGVGVRVDHNHLHDAPHQSILLAGNDHIVEYNDVHHISMDSDDCGAFYMGRNPSERGNVIRRNFWRNIGSSFNHGSCAVYFDDGTGGQLVEGNVFFRAAGGNFGAVFLHGGHDNRVENNLFIDCKRAVGHAPWNDAYWNEWMEGELWKTRLREEVNVEDPLYLERYPEVAGLLEAGTRPRVNYATGNVLLGCGSVCSGNWDLARTIFRNDVPPSARGDHPTFEFLSDPEWWKQFPDLPPIPVEQIGLYVDPYRPQIDPEE